MNGRAPLAREVGAPRLDGDGPDSDSLRSRFGFVADEADATEGGGRFGSEGLGGDSLRSRFGTVAEEVNATEGEYLDVDRHGRIPNCSLVFQPY